MCIVCQDSSALKGPLVLQPRTDSCQRLLEVVQEWTRICSHIQGQLKECTKETLIEKGTVWYRTRYSFNATNQVCIQHAREWMQHALSTGSYPVKQCRQKRARSGMEEPSSASPLVHLRDLQQLPSTKTCFFCQKDDGQRLFTVGTENRP